MDIRKLTEKDIPALQAAIDSDNFHKGEWKLEHFLPQEGSPPKVVNVIEDSQGPIAFVRYTKTLRISCVWADGDDNRNAKAIIQGIRDAVTQARASGFTEIIIKTNHEKLATFFTKVIKMTKSRDEYILYV